MKATLIVVCYLKTNMSFISNIPQFFLKYKIHMTDVMITKSNFTLFRKALWKKESYSKSFIPLGFISTILIILVIQRRPLTNRLIFAN